MSECNVCVEKYNKSGRAEVICGCGYCCCRSCVKKYLLEKSEDAHCMSCKVGWSRKFMSENFDKSFMMKSYKDHREEILIEREIGMLQATQPYVECEIKLEKLVNEQRLLEKEMNEIKRKTAYLQDQINEIILNVNVEKKKFIRKCPNGDCEGFLSTSLKCEICEKYSCSECREVKEENHECDDEIVSSVKFLAKDSKPCPKCSSMTFKIVGCSQMYCVECHTPWDWNSGKIVNGTIHNPHYIEYLAQQNGGQAPRTIGDIECGREIDNNFLNILVQNEYSNSVIDIAISVIHIRHVELRRFSVNGLEDNLQLRIDFMRKKIDKINFKKAIQKKEKQNEKRREISNVIEMYINCITDIFYRLTPKNVNETSNEMNELRKYTNCCFIDISKSFNNKGYCINEKYKFK